MTQSRRNFVSEMCKCLKFHAAGIVPFFGPGARQGVFLGGWELAVDAGRSEQTNLRICHAFERPVCFFFHRAENSMLLLVGCEQQQSIQMPTTISRLLCHGEAAYMKDKTKISRRVPGSSWANFCSTSIYIDIFNFTLISSLPQRIPFTVCQCASHPCIAVQCSMGRYHSYSPLQTMPIYINIYV